jgi:WD40 repeat protein
VGDSDDAVSLAAAGTRVLAVAVDPPDLDPESVAPPDRAFAATDAVRALYEVFGKHCNLAERNIRILVNPLTPDDISAALDEAAAGATRTILFCYVGQVACSTDGDAYLTCGSTGDQASVVPETGLPVAAVTAALRRSAAPNKVLLVDGWPTTGETAGGRLVDDGRADGLEAVATLSAAGEISAEAGLAGRLATLIGDGDPDGPPRLTLDYLVRRVRQEITARDGWRFERTASERSDSFVLCDNQIPETQIPDSPIRDSPIRDSQGQATGRSSDALTVVGAAPTDVAIARTAGETFGTRDAGGKRVAARPVPRAFVHASPARQQAGQRAGRRERLLRQLVAVLVVLVLLAVGAMGFAFHQRSDAAHQRDQARSRAIAGQAEQLQGLDRGLAAQLALVAYRLEPTTEARSALLDSGPFTRHGGAQNGAIGATAYSPDGKIIATGSDDGTVALWDATTPSRHDPVSVLRGHPLAVRSVAFNRTGKIIATGSDDRAVRLWNISDPARPTQIGAPIQIGGGVYGLAFSPTADLLAAGGAADTVRLYDVSDPARPVIRAVIRGHHDAVRAVAFNRAGTLLATGGEDGLSVIWDVSRPAAPKAVAIPVIPAKEGRSAIRALAFSTDGRRFATGDQLGNLRWFDVTNPRRTTEIYAPGLASAKLPIVANGPITALAISPDDQSVAVASESTQVVLYRPEVLAQAYAYLVHGWTTWSLAFSPDGTALATGSEDHDLRIWQLPGPVLPSVGGTLSAGAAAAKGRIIAVSDSSGALALWDVTDPDNARRLSVVDRTGRSYQLAFFDGDTMLATAGGTDVQVYDVRDKTRPTPLATMPVAGQSARRLAVSRDGRRLAVGGATGGVELWDVSNPASPRRLSSTPAHSADITRVAFSPDGKTLATTSIEGRVTLWEVGGDGALKPLATMSYPSGIDGAQFSPDGRLLAVGGTDKIARLYDVTTPRAPKLLSSLTGATGYLNATVFSPDGMTLAVAGTDLRLWNVRNPSHPVLADLWTDISSSINDLAFSADGQLAIPIVANPSTHIYDLDPTAIAARICQTVGDPITRDEWNQYLPDLPYKPPCT